MDDYSNYPNQYRTRNEAVRYRKPYERVVKTTATRIDWITLEIRTVPVWCRVMK